MSWFQIMSHTVLLTYFLSSLASTSLPMIVFYGIRVDVLYATLGCTSLDADIPVPEAYAYDMIGLRDPQ